MALREALPSLGGGLHSAMNGSEITDTMAHLPAQIDRWLIQNRWNTKDVTLLKGGYSAKLYRMYAKSLCTDGLSQEHFSSTDQDGPASDAAAEDGTPNPFIYKHCAPSRSMEIPLLKALSGKLADFMPAVVTIIDTPQEHGVLMHDGGPTLKSLLRHGTPSENRWILESFARFLAKLHLSFATDAKRWNSHRILPSYPFHASHTYAEDALARLSWLATQRAIEGWSQPQVNSLTQQAETFYASFERFVAGPLTLTHGDPHLDNILLHNREFRLIDWEFACLATPQRDLSIFLQDILDDQLYERSYTAYVSAMSEGGWPILANESTTAYLAWLFDNTLMMLGWEVEKYTNGHLDGVSLTRILAVKHRRMEQAFERLFKRTSQP